MSGQLHALASLPPRKESQGEWTPNLVWTLWRTEKLAPAKN
jgi:hypothetical protein